MQACIHGILNVYVYTSKAVGILRVILFRLLPNIFTLFWTNEGHLTLALYSQNNQ